MSCTRNSIPWLSAAPRREARQSVSGCEGTGIKKKNGRVGPAWPQRMSWVFFGLCVESKTERNGTESKPNPLERTYRCCRRCRCRQVGLFSHPIGFLGGSPVSRERKVKLGSWQVLWTLDFPGGLAAVLRAVPCFSGFEEGHNRWRGVCPYVHNASVPDGLTD